MMNTNNYMRQQTFVIVICLACITAFNSCATSKAGSSGDTRDMRNRSRDRREIRGNNMRTGAIERIEIKGKA
jgi:hypothetical protein